MVPIEHIIGTTPGLAREKYNGGSRTTTGRQKNTTESHWLGGVLNFIKRVYATHSTAAIIAGACCGGKGSGQTELAAIELAHLRKSQPASSSRIVLADLVCESSLRFVSRLIANVRYRRFCACQFGNALPFRTMAEFARPGRLGGGLLSTLLAFERARELLIDDDGDEGHGR